MTGFRLPILRLPTLLFPREPLTLGLASSRITSPPLTSSLAREAAQTHAGRVAALGDGQQVGVVMQLLGDGEEGAPLLHGLGLSERCVLREIGERSNAGWRIGQFEPLGDVPLDDSEALQLITEAERAYSLLEEGEIDGSIELMPCTLDDELELWACNPRDHPFWRESSTMPPVEDAAALSMHLAARLPLTTTVRLHMLSCTCPLKRMRDIVDAMETLTCPKARAGGGRYATAENGEERLHKFRLVYDTAEASGCELEPPRPVIDWVRY
eukprot:scaffold70414_cov35-Tisochrysis_lutea.AAC.1